MTKSKRNAKVHTTREGWLMAAMKMLNAQFLKKTEYEFPETVRVSCGFTRGHSTSIGQCWARNLSADKTHEIFICPTKAEPIRVLDILLHEMIHVAVGLKCGHRGKFRELAKSVGLSGKMTATRAEPGSELHRQLEKLAERLGGYPHAAMSKKYRASKQSKWVRFMSPNETTFRVVVNIDKVTEHGVPRDPWGDAMVRAT